jgi:AcrR family transcriptional regulator
MTLHATIQKEEVVHVTPTGHAPSNVPSDGRAYRRVRTREKILAALFALIGEGILRPRSEEIAERAEVAVRTIFRHFTDMDGLYAAAQAHLEELLDAELDQPSLDGTLEERARAYAELQGGIFESIRNYLLFYISRVRTADEANALRTANVSQQRLRLWTALPECAAASVTTRRTVEQLYSFQFWDQVRFEQRVSIEDTIDSITEATTALLSADNKRA